MCGQCVRALEQKRGKEGLTRKKQEKKKIIRATIFVHSAISNDPPSQTWPGLTPPASPSSSSSLSDESPVPVSGLLLLPPCVALAPPLRGPSPSFPLKPLSSSYWRAEGIDGEQQNRTLKNKKRLAPRGWVGRVDSSGVRKKRKEKRSTEEHECFKICFMAQTKA